MVDLNDAVDSASSARRLPAGRIAQIAAYVTEVGEATVAELAERFGVSAYTIRRDLDRLDSDGILVRTHGGGLSPSSFPKPDSEFDVRTKIHTGAKEEIGRLAAGLIKDNSTITINSGTTTLALVRHLREHRDLTIVTNSLTLPGVINPTVCRDLYVVGGLVRFTSQATIGAYEIEFGQDHTRIHIQSDLALIGVGAISISQGYSTSNVSEAGIMSAMFRQATSVAVLADSSKFNRTLFSRVAELGAADYLVTDTAPTGKLGEALADSGVQVITPAC